jgi:hypothetical protein
VGARRVRTDRWGDASVGDGGGKPGSDARVWHSLDVDRLNNAKPAERGQHDTNSGEDCRDGRSGDVYTGQPGT